MCHRLQVRIGGRTWSGLDQRYGIFFRGDARSLRKSVVGQIVDANATGDALVPPVQSEMGALQLPPTALPCKVIALHRLTAIGCRVSLGALPHACFPHLNPLPPERHGPLKPSVDTPDGRTRGARSRNEKQRRHPARTARIPQESGRRTVRTDHGCGTRGGRTRTGVGRRPRRQPLRRCHRVREPRLVRQGRRRARRRSHRGRAVVRLDGPHRRDRRHTRRARPARAPRHGRESGSRPLPGRHLQPARPGLRRTRLQRRTRPHRAEPLQGRLHRPHRRHPR